MYTEKAIMEKRVKIYEGMGGPFDTFGRFNQWGCCCFEPIQPVGSAHVCYKGGGEGRHLSVAKGGGGAWPHPLPLGDTHGGVGGDKSVIEHWPHVYCLHEHCHMYTAYMNIATCILLT